MRHKIEDILNVFIIAALALAIGFISGRMYERKRVVIDHRIDMVALDLHAEDKCRDRIERMLDSMETTNLCLEWKVEIPEWEEK